EIVNSGLLLCDGRRSFGTRSSGTGFFGIGRRRLLRQMGTDPLVLLFAHDALLVERLIIFGGLGRRRFGLVHPLAPALHPQDSPPSDEEGAEEKKTGREQIEVEGNGGEQLWLGPRHRSNPLVQTAEPRRAQWSATPVRLLGPVPSRPLL